MNTELNTPSGKPKSAKYWLFILLILSANLILNLAITHGTDHYQESLNYHSKPLFDNFSNAEKQAFSVQAQQRPFIAKFIKTQLQSVLTFILYFGTFILFTLGIWYFLSIQEKLSKIVTLCLFTYLPSAVYTVYLAIDVFTREQLFVEPPTSYWSLNSLWLNLANTDAYFQFANAVDALLILGSLISLVLLRLRTNETLSNCVILAFTPLIMLFSLLYLIA